MVAEVDLESIARPLVRSEGLHLGPGRPQVLDVTPRKLARADLVVQEVDLHPRPRPLLQGLAECGPDPVGAHDEELDQDVPLGLFDLAEHGLKRLAAVDEKFYVVAAGEGQRSQAGRRLVDAFETRKGGNRMG